MNLYLFKDDHLIVDWIFSEKINSTALLIYYQNGAVVPFMLVVTKVLLCSYCSSLRLK